MHLDFTAISKRSEFNTLLIYIFLILTIKYKSILMNTFRSEEKHLINMGSNDKGSSNN